MFRVCDMAMPIASKKSRSVKGFKPSHTTTNSASSTFKVSFDWKLYRSDHVDRLVCESLLNLFVNFAVSHARVL